jgi:phospholipase C
MPKTALCRSICALAAICLFLIVPVRLTARPDGDDAPTTTPIKHVVVIFQENVSFDHYFGTYPHAMPNADGSVYFHGPKDDTPRANTLESAGLLTNNPNFNNLHDTTVNGTGANPFRMDRAHVNTCDEDHNYNDEQYVARGGLMDGFTGFKADGKTVYSCKDAFYGPYSVMGYFDGNTVTALWNYAQNFAMSDSHFGTTFGPSTPGLLNMISGNTYGGTIEKGTGALKISGGSSTGTFGSVIGDSDPFGDMCSTSAVQIRMTTGQSIGDLLDAKGITWGDFMGAFGDQTCKEANTGLTGLNDGGSYIPHHAFAQYWLSTLNANHTPPASVHMVGKTDGSTFHEYDLSYFFAALKAGDLPAVSILKAPAFEDGHAGYSDPLDEQFFLVNTINALMKSDEWNETAVIITWDDSDGWYDHVLGPIVSQSDAPEDDLLGPGNCGTAKPIAPGGIVENGRCGYGPRIPFLVISPWAKPNYVDHKAINFASIDRFIEDNWNLGGIGNGSADATSGTLNGMFDFDDGPRAGKLFLDPSTGMVVGHGDDHDGR